MSVGLEMQSDMIERELDASTILPLLAPHLAAHPAPFALHLMMCHTMSVSTPNPSPTMYGHTSSPPPNTSGHTWPGMVGGGLDMWPDGIGL